MSKVKDTLIYKRILPLLLSVLLITAFASTALAAEEPDVKVTNASAQSPPELFPTTVEELRGDGTRQIIKTYALEKTDDPAGIPRASFDRDGWSFEITDVTKKETATSDVKEYIETVTLDSESKEMDVILGMLSPTIDFESDDGYTGILDLDATSILVEQSGTKTSSYTVSATRDYPNLSRNDSSLLPKTVTDKGRVLSFDSVEWVSDITGTDEYGELTESWTAHVNYTAGATRTVITGYTVTANYIGMTNRLIDGKTIYTAYFKGTEIVPEPEPVVKSNHTGVIVAVCLVVVAAGIVAGFMYRGRKTAH
jgi:hypothetical protein